MLVVALHVWDSQKSHWDSHWRSCESSELAKVGEEGRLCAFSQCSDPWLKVILKLCRVKDRSLHTKCHNYLAMMTMSHAFVRWSVYIQHQHALEGNRVGSSRAQSYRCEDSWFESGAVPDHRLWTEFMNVWSFIVSQPTHTNCTFYNLCDQMLRPESIWP